MKPIIDKNGKRWLLLEYDEEHGDFLYKENRLKFLDYKSDDNIRKRFEDANSNYQEIEYTDDHDYEEDDYDPEDFPFWENDEDIAWQYVAVCEGGSSSNYFNECWKHCEETVLILRDEKPLENNRGGDYNKSIGDTNMANVNTNINVGSLMNIKMVEKLLDKDDFDIKDLMDYQMKVNVMNGLANGQGVDINDIMRQKLMTKYMLDDKAEDMNFAQLAILNMLQSGRIDINQLVMVKMLEKLDK